MTGDGAVVARVTSVQNVNSWTKASVMIRETLDPARRRPRCSCPPARERHSSGAPRRVASAPGPPARWRRHRYWLKLERIGPTFNAYTSADGASWTLVGSDTIPMASTVYVGLAVSSHTTAAAASATFDNVTAP